MRIRRLSAPGGYGALWAVVVLQGLIGVALLRQFAEFQDVVEKSGLGEKPPALRTVEHPNLSRWRVARDSR
jgi:hypothetical protein